MVPGRHRLDARSGERGLVGGQPGSKERAAGPGKDIAVGQVQQRVSAGDASTVPVEVAGFRLLSYTGERATVEVVLAGDDGTEKTYITSSADLMWQDGDWHFALQDNGDTGPVSGRVSDLNRYIEWGPHDG